jgi:hypothetical protein
LQKLSQRHDSETDNEHDDNSSRPILGHPQPIEWVAGVKGYGHEGDQSPPTTAEVKYTWMYTPTHEQAFVAWRLTLRGAMADSARHCCMNVTGDQE